MSQTIFALMAAVVIISITNRCEGSRSIPCPPPCETPGCYECQHDKYMNICGQMSCLGGPEARCGGPANVMGKCAVGLTCNCERCTGCAMGALDLSFKCYENDFLCEEVSRKPSKM